MPLDIYLREQKLGLRHFTAMFLWAWNGAAKVGSSQVSTDRWADKQDMLWTPSGVLFSLRKKKIWVSCNTDDLEDIVFTRQASHKKTNTEWLHLNDIFRVLRVLQKVEPRLPWVGRRWEQRVTFLLDTKFQTHKMKRILNMGGIDGWIIWMYLISLKCAIKKVTSILTQQRNTQGQWCPALAVYQDAL